MTANAQSSFSRTDVQAFPPLRHHSRRVLVRVLADGYELDSFEVSRPDVLVAALRPIYAHLPRQGVAIRFRGIEEKALPLGIDRVRREVDLAGLSSALSYLGDTAGGAALRRAS